MYSTDNVKVFTMTVVTLEGEGQRRIGGKEEEEEEDISPVSRDTQPTICKGLGARVPD